MGLKLGSIIPKKQIEFEDLKNKKIAVDASQMLYQFISSIRQPDGTLLQDSNGNITSHLMGISTRIPNLIQKEIKPCFVFDGIPPKIKTQEQEKRRALKEAAKEKFEEAEESGDESLMLKYSKQTSRVNKEMFEETKELLQAFGLPILQAPSEAEAQCSYLAKNKDVDYVGSSDYDALLYEAPLIVRNLTVSQRRKIGSSSVKIYPEIIELKQVLEELKITQEQLLILAILTGTDYNPGGIKGIGPKKALKLIKENNNYDKIFKDLNSEFDWNEIYDTFKNMQVEKNSKLKWSPINKEKVKEILIEKHEFNQERIDKMLSQFKDNKNSSLDKWG